MFDLPKYGAGICLARLSELLEAFEIDRIWLSRISVVVTGSNGKGSTAAFCDAIARARELRTGLFTSPHLFRFNERIQINGEPIGDDDWRRHHDEVMAAIEPISRQRGEGFGSFEAMFALACVHFKEQACDFAVFEAGIGGRFDPIRLVGSSITTVTSVDLEHVELLGNSLPAICSDKSDACAAPGTIIYGENCRPLRAHILEYNRSREIGSLFVRDEIGIANESASPSAQRFDLTFCSQTLRGLETSLIGSFQFNNAAIAATLFLLWQQQNAQDTAEENEAALRTGLRGARWPGRLETIAQDPLTIIDVGHTPDGIRQSLASLKAIHGEQGWVLVTGVSFNKNVAEIVNALAPSFDQIVCTSAHHKGADASEIAQTARNAHAAAMVHVARDVADAVRIGREIARTSNRKIYVAGGLFLAIEFAAVVEGRALEELNFY